MVQSVTISVAFETQSTGDGKRAIHHSVVEHTDIYGMLETIDNLRKELALVVVKQQKADVQDEVYKFDLVF